MSDETDTKVLDLGPALLAKKHRECTHPRALVDDTAAELECAECGAMLDPWWYLRKLAHDESILVSNVERYQQLEAQAEAKYLELTKRLQEQLDYYTAAVNHLIDVKNRLWNETTPEGRPLGAVAARVRRRKVSSGKPREQG